MSAWTSEPPRIGDFKGARAIYIVRGGSLNYPVPVVVAVGVRARPSPHSELNFQFTIDGIEGITMWRDQLQTRELLQGLEWFGPCRYPD